MIRTGDYGNKPKSWVWLQGKLREMTEEELKRLRHAFYKNKNNPMHSWMTYGRVKQ